MQTKKISSNPYINFIINKNGHYCKMMYREISLNTSDHEQSDSDASENGPVSIIAATEAVASGPADTSPVSEDCD